MPIARDFFKSQRLSRRMAPVPVFHAKGVKIGFGQSSAPTVRDILHNGAYDDVTGGFLALEAAKASGDIEEIRDAVNGVFWVKLIHADTRRAERLYLDLFRISGGYPGRPTLRAFMASIGMPMTEVPDRVYPASSGAPNPLPPDISPPTVDIPGYGPVPVDENGLVPVNPTNPSSQHVKPDDAIRFNEIRLAQESIIRMNEEAAEHERLMAEAAAYRALHPLEEQYRDAALNPSPFQVDPGALVPDSGAAVTGPSPVPEQKKNYVLPLALAALAFFMVKG